MIKSFCIFAFSIMSLITLAQNYTDGFHVGYKAGYCYNDYGCAAPSAAPSVPKPGKNTYQDGYNDGFAKGQADKTSRDSNRKSNSSNQPTPTKVEPIDFSGAINSGIKQAQENKKSELEIQQKRLELEKQQIELLKIREEQEKAYEQKINKTPEIDFSAGTIEKVKTKIPNHYSIQFFQPEKWATVAVSNKLLWNRRSFDDGSILDFCLQIDKSPKGSALDFINAHYDTAASISKAMLDIMGTPGPLGYQVNIVTPGKSADISGVKPGDVITMIDGKTVVDADIMKLYKDKKVGDSVQIDLIRNNEHYFTMAKLLSREGFFYGKLTISGFPAVFVSQVKEYTDYGIVKRYLCVNNFVAVNDDVFLFVYFISPSSEVANFDNEFKRFNKTFKTHLGSIKINY